MERMELQKKVFQIIAAPFHPNFSKYTEMAQTNCQQIDTYGQPLPFASRVTAHEAAKLFGWLEAEPHR
jgi:hypothetical protein